MKKTLVIFSLVFFFPGCESPFEINPAPAAQVMIALYDGIPVRTGDTLSAEIPGLSDFQKLNMKITYTWYRDDEAAALRSGAEHPQSETDTKYTVKTEDFGKSIKVKASFMYNESVSVSYAVLDIHVTTARAFAELRELLAEAGNENSLEITAAGDFTIPEAVSVPANVTLKINSAVTADSNVTVQGKMIVGTGALTVKPSNNIALVAGSAFTVENGGNVYLSGTFDNSGGTIVNNGKITIESGATLTAEPARGTGGAGKYIVNQGGMIPGFIGAGGVIDNSQPGVVTLAAGGVELTSGAVTVIDNWTISGTLTVNGQITVDSGKDIKGEGTEANSSHKIIVKPGAAVTGGAGNLNLTEGTYTWGGSSWVSE